MQLLHAATLSVADLDAARQRYETWLDYKTIEVGVLSNQLSSGWGAINSAGARYAILQPASGADVYLRFVEATAVEGYRPLRTYGWAAIEICVSDVEAVAARMAESPFEIIGPPRLLDGMPAIYPMQVKGPDEEIVYLTEIRDDLPEYNLPRAETLIDKLFILVLACSDMHSSIEWFEKNAGLARGRELDIEYTMLANAFNTPPEQRYTIATMIHERDVFLELDQYPDAATVRPKNEGMLPPGVSMITLKTPDLGALTNNWISEPRTISGALYNERVSGCKIAPDGTLVEIIEAS